MYLPCLETPYFFMRIFKKSLPWEGGFPPPHPPPARSLRSLAHIFQAPSSPPQNFYSRTAPDGRWTANAQEAIFTVLGSNWPGWNKCLRQFVIHILVEVITELRTYVKNKKKGHAYQQRTRNLSSPVEKNKFGQKLLTSLIRQIH